MRQHGEWLFIMCVILIFCILTLECDAMADEVEARCQVKLSDLTDKGDLTIVAQGHIEGLGYVLGQDTDDDGSPDAFWLLYRWGDPLFGRMLCVRALSEHTIREFYKQPTIRGAK